MQISYNGIQVLKELEGFRSKAYKDTGGVWTIGYGNTEINGIPVYEGQVCTLAEAEEELKKDLAWSQTAVNQLVRVPLKQNQFDALVSFVYNIGDGAFTKSTLLRLLNTGDYQGAAKQLDRWVFDNGRRIPGLVSRRAIERSLFEQ